MTLLTPCPAVVSALPEVLLGIAGSTPQQNKVPTISPELTLQKPVQKHGHVLIGCQPGNPPLRGCLQDTSSNAAHQVIEAGVETKGMGANCSVTEVSHMRDVGTPLPIRDVQNLIAGP